MPRLTLAVRRSMLLLALVSASALTACADPTAPTPRTPTAEVRHSGYLIICGAKDSTSAGGGSEQ